ncbi:MAG: hypothetical protein D6729_09395 [Deltaproteobacteria bacterium]|nr:MAG: hypothetical protein D6729_09395 [Deltaproteobacteria bacterium]
MLRHVEAFVKARHDAAAWERLVATLPESDREVLGGLVLDGAWYPIGTWNRILGALCEAPGAHPRTLLLEMARFMADRDLNVVFKVLLRMRSPAYIVKRTPQLWKRHYDMGSVSVTQEETHFSVRLEAPTDIEDGPCRWVCNEGTIGWMTHALELVGVDRPRVAHVACRFDGEPACRYDVRY